eukprot:tig00021015_g17172.t1
MTVAVSPSGEMDNAGQLSGVQVDCPVSARGCFGYLLPALAPPAGAAGPAAAPNVGIDRLLAPFPSPEALAPPGCCPVDRPAAAHQRLRSAIASSGLASFGAADHEGLGALPAPAGTSDEVPLLEGLAAGPATLSRRSCSSRRLGEGSWRATRARARARAGAWPALPRRPRGTPEHRSYGGYGGLQLAVGIDRLLLPLSFPDLESPAPPACSCPVDRPARRRLPRLERVGPRLELPAPSAEL